MTPSTTPSGQRWWKIARDSCRRSQDRAQPAGCQARAGTRPKFGQFATRSVACDHVETKSSMRAWTRPFAVALLGAAVQASEKPAVAGMETGRYLAPLIRTTSTSGITGHTTFTVSVTAAPRSAQQDRALSVYAIFGDKQNDAHLRLPPCYHVPAPFGVNIGGTNPAFWAVSPDAQYDSWLSVGVTRGNVHNEISSIGIDWAVCNPRSRYSAHCVLSFRPSR